MRPADALMPMLNHDELYVRQVHEMAELFGFETRNKYGIFTNDRTQVGYAAEQGSGIFGLLARSMLGHWRRFDILFFDALRQPLFRAVHPFRFFFQRLEIYTAQGQFLGALQQRWSLFRKRFDVQGPQGNVVLEMSSGFFKPWTFPFSRNGNEVAVIEKKWSGAFSEFFTDKDNFRVRFVGSLLTRDERLLVLAAAVFIDLQYFERKANN